MRDVALLLNELMDILIVIATIHAEMLFTIIWMWARNDNRDNQLISGPFVMTVGARDMYRQRGTALVNQQVDLAPLFAPVCWISAGLFAAQRRWTAFAINRLPVPLDVPFPGIEPDHNLHNSRKDACLLPRLETVMQGTAANSKPILVNRFPLTARPQDIPDAIQDISIVRWWSPSATLPGWLGKHLSDLPPQRVWHAIVVNIFRFWGSIVAQEASRFRWVGDTPILYEMPSFFTPQFILRIDT